jgi:hypothetical protein
MNIENGMDTLLGELTIEKGEYLWVNYWREWRKTATAMNIGIFGMGKCIWFWGEKADGLAAAGNRILEQKMDGFIWIDLEKEGKRPNWELGNEGGNSTEKENMKLGGWCVDE